MIKKEMRSYIDIEYIKEYTELFNLKIQKIPDFDGTTHSESNPEFVEFFRNELLSIENDNYKAYIIETDNIPHLFFGTKEYLMYLNINPAFYNESRVVIFNSNIEHLFKYKIDLSYKVEKNDFSEIHASNNLCNYFYSTIGYAKKIEPRVINELKDYTITTYKKNKKITIQSNSKKNISDIKYTKDSIMVSFNNSFYNKMFLDYDFNINSLDFHHSIKKNLNISSEFKNIKDFNSIMKNLKDNFEWYKLLNDSNYKMPINENDFNHHLNVIKCFTKNKEDIINHSMKIFNFYENYKFDLDMFNLFRTKFIEKNLFYMNFSESVIGINPFKTLNYIGFDNFNKYSFDKKDTPEILTKIFATLLMLKYKKQNPIPIGLIKHVIEVSKSNNELMNKYNKDFSKI